MNLNRHFHHHFITIKLKRFVRKYANSVVYFPQMVHVKWKSLFSLKNNQLITKTCLYNFDPLKPHFYIVKLGFTGVYIIFLMFALNIDCRYSLEPPRRGGSNEYMQSMVSAEI